LSDFELAHEKGLDVHGVLGPFRDGRWITHQEGASRDFDHSYCHAIPNIFRVISSVTLFNQVVTRAGPQLYRGKGK